MTIATKQTSALLNGLLASLAPSELDHIQACLVRVPLVRDQMLAEHGQPIDHAFFIEQGVVSVVSEPLDGEAGVQVAMIGREGMVGDLSLVDMRHAACGRVLVHIPGTALRIASGDLRRAIERSPALRAACARFVQSLLTQVMQTAACNARRSLAERCARWLVMTHERIDGNEVRVTHEALSEILGMRRCGVTVAAAALQQAGLIRTGRGRFVILDRAGLQDVAQGGGPVLQGALPRAGSTPAPLHSSLPGGHSLMNGIPPAASSHTWQEGVDQP